MIFFTLNQFNCFLIFIFFGIILNLIYNLFSILFLKNFQKKLKIIIFDTIFYSFFNIFLIFLINFLNFGKPSFTLLTSSYLGFYLTKRLYINLVVFLEKKWYTIVNKNYSKRKTRKCKQTEKLN